MNFSLVARLAFRYLRGKGSANAVPILSRISMVAIGVSSAAMIILFSVFNGFEGLIDSLYKAFYPDLKISAVKGKFFDPQQQAFKEALQDKTQLTYTYVLEDNVLINREEGSTIPVRIKGVNNDFFIVNDLKPYMIKGNDTLLSDPIPTSIVGQHIAASLGIDVNNVFSRLMVYYPNPETKGFNLAPEAAFQSLMLKPDGVFTVQDEFDSKYILAPLAKVQTLMHQSNMVSSVEVKVTQHENTEQLKELIQQKLGPAYKVANRYEQNKTVYMVMRSEKWAGYAILLFVLLIASFNMISALSLLVLEKQKDMGILRSMGMMPRNLSYVVLLEGVLWALLGGGIGILSGLLLCWAQQQFKLVKIQGAFIIDAYPVQVQLMDVIVVLATIATVGFLAALYPAQRASKQKLNEIMSGK